MTDGQQAEPIRRLHCLNASGGDRSRRSSLTPRLALRSIDARMDFAFWSTANARPVDFVGLTARVKPNDVWHRIDGKNCAPPL